MNFVQNFGYSGRRNGKGRKDAASEKGLLKDWCESSLMSVFSVG